MTTIGSLCSGYGGLDMAAEAFFGATTLWVSDVDPDASTVLARRFPGAPNLGDLKALRWDDVPPVDVLTAGYPCQPFSQAGLRRGHHDERHLWPHIRDGIEALRPKAVLLENVRGHLRLGAGQVISDLAHLGYVGRWEVVRASDAGACHRRERLFILGWQYRGPTPPHPGRLGAQLHGGRGDVVGAQGGPCHEDGGDDHEGRPTPGDRPTGHRPSPGGRGDRGWHEEGVEPGGWLLPTPTARMSQRGISSPRLAAERMSPAGGSRRNLDDALSLLPTPTSADYKGSRRATARTAEWGSNEGVTLTDALWMAGGLHPVDWAERWGPYAPAVARWAEVFGRCPPEPLQGRQVHARFVEWMMGLEDGHVAELVPNRRALKVLGNGVVPQQALHALHRLTADIL
jgi:DNA (cytosine-5)-methyltransferase 1